MIEVSESEFRSNLYNQLNDEEFLEFGVVTGPGRSGAIASVYASHHLGIPFIPYGVMPPMKLGRLLIIDTASQTGKTLRKASKKYDNITHSTHAVYSTTTRHRFWYERK